MAAADEARKAIFWYDEENLSAEQKRQYEVFRTMLQQQDPPVLVPGLDDRLTLLRFLKARQWSPAKALKMYQAMAQWRHEHKVEEMVQTFVFTEREAVKRCYPHFYHKTDKWGRPVYIELLGEANVHQLLGVTTMDRFFNYHVQTCEVLRTEKLPACSAAARRPILTTTIILDMAGFSTSHFTLQVKRFLETMSRVDQDYYPEHLGTMFIINAPLLFRSIWAFVKPFLDERTLNKIKVLGSNYKKELLELIPAENLLQRFGGLSVCDSYDDVGPWGATLFERQATCGAKLAEAMSAAAVAVAAGGAATAVAAAAAAAAAAGQHAAGEERTLEMESLVQVQAWGKVGRAASKGAKMASFVVPPLDEPSVSTGGMRSERSLSVSAPFSPSRKVSDCGSVYLTAASSMVSELTIGHTCGASESVVLLLAAEQVTVAPCMPAAAPATSPKGSRLLQKLGSCCMAPKVAEQEV